MPRSWLSKSSVKSFKSKWLLLVPILLSTTTFILCEILFFRDLIPVGNIPEEEWQQFLVYNYYWDFSFIFSFSFFTGIVLLILIYVYKLSDKYKIGYLFISGNVVISLAMLFILPSFVNYYSFYRYFSYIFFILIIGLEYLYFIRLIENKLYNEWIIEQGLDKTE